MLRFLLLALLLAASSAAAQTPAFDVEATYNYGSPVTHTAFLVQPDGAFVARGFVRDAGGSNLCTAFLPVTGAGTRFMWLPCRGAVRFGRAPVGPGSTTWDDANMDDFTFAGGNQVTASGYGAFAYGDQVNVSSTVGVGFGSGIEVSGTAGFSAGASNVCSGFACTAIGYTTSASGQGSTALGYRTHARGDYTTALGYRAQTCTTSLSTGSTACSGTTYTGGFIFGDEGTVNFVHPTADNQFVVRAEGGVRFYTNGNNTSSTSPYVPSAGVFLTAGGSAWNVVSDRARKEAFAPVDGEALLAGLAQLPVTTWRYLAEEDRSVRHIGPMAQDWQRLVAGPLALNADSTTINQGDFDGVNLMAAIALEARTRDLTAEVDALRAEVATLRATLSAERADAGARLARLEALLAPATTPGTSVAARAAD